MKVTERQSTYSLFIWGKPAAREGAKALKCNGSWVIAHCEQHTPQNLLGISQGCFKKAIHGKVVTINCNLCFHKEIFRPPGKRKKCLQKEGR